MRPFVPSWWLPGAHLPTIWGKKFRRERLAHDRVERISTPDRDHLTLVRRGRARPGVPHLLVLHGLEGTMRAKYAHGLLEQAARRGWSADLLMFRSCDGELNSARRLYHSGETTDVDFIARRLRKETPDAALVVCGVSLGGNVLLKWLGELGESGPEIVSRAAAVSVPFDLAAGSTYLERGLSPLYTRHFLKTLRPKALAKARQFPGSIDVDRVLAARTFWEFDDASTAPLHGFSSAADYYERSSSINFLTRIRVPTLLLCSEDDPFVPPIALSMVRAIAGTNAAMECEFTPRGGHVGWIEGQPWAPHYYMEGRTIEYLSGTVA